MWQAGYAAEARRAYGFQVRTLDEALAIVSPFVNALLDGSAAGSWNPLKRSWE